MNSRVSVLEGEYLENGVDADLEKDFQEFRDALNQAEDAEGTISAYRLPTDALGNPIAKSKKQSFLFTMPMGSVSLIDIINRIKREYMREGEHFIAVRLTGNQRGHHGSKFNKVIYIDKENEPPKAAPAPGQTDVAALMRSMSDMMQMQQQRADAFMQQILRMQMETRAPAPAPVNNDPMAFMERMVMMQATMSRVGQMFGLNGAAPGAAALPAPTNAADQLLQTVKVMKEMQAIMNPGAAPEGEGDSIMKGITALAGPAFTLMAETERTKRAMIERGAVKRVGRQPATSAQPARPAQQAQPATVDAAAVEDAEVSTDDEVSDMNLAQVRDMLKSLCEMAAEGTDAKDAADLILDQIPDEADAQVADLVHEVNKDSFMRKISTAYAPCRDHAEWFEQLRVHLDAAFESDPDAQTH